MELNQCDGCRRGLPIENGLHRTFGGRPEMGCTADRYGAVPLVPADPRVEIDEWRAQLEATERTIVGLYVALGIPERLLLAHAETPAHVVYPLSDGAGI